MSIYKSIFSGRLEFGSARSFEKVLKLYQHRTENYYRNDVLLDEEEIFEDGTFSLNVPRLISESSEKSWRNTVNLLKYINEFAVAGNFRVWVIKDRKLIEKVLIEPESDKVAVQAYLKGRELVQEGMEDEAIKALNRAIEKFERHALAYERRGAVNFMLRNYKDAAYDFSKSIDLNPNNAEPYWGRANVSIKNGDIAGAVSDLGLAAKKSIPHQSIYWKAKRLKAECHLILNEPQKAIFELKLFTKRAFTTDNPNYNWRKNAFYMYGKALLEVGEYSEAIDAFNAALNIEEGKEEASPADQFLYRGIAKQKAGESGFVKDFKEAAGLGSEKAAELLEEIA